MAEVYWDLEWTMQQQGFDYAYDKRLYDRLREGHPQAVRGHLHGRPGLPEPLGTLPRKPRRAKGGGHFLPGHARGCGHHHLSCRRACVSFIKANSMAASSASLRTSFAVRTNR